MLLHPVDSSVFVWLCRKPISQSLDVSGEGSIVSDSKFVIIVEEKRVEAGMTNGRAASRTWEWIMWFCSNTEDNGGQDKIVVKDLSSYAVNERWVMSRNVSEKHLKDSLLFLNVVILAVVLRKYSNCPVLHPIRGFGEVIVMGGMNGSLWLWCVQCFIWSPWFTIWRWWATLWIQIMIEVRERVWRCRMEWNAVNYE